MKETVVLLKTGEEFVYPGLADVNWSAEDRVVDVLVEGKEAADMYNIDTVAYIRFREKEEAMIQQAKQLDGNSMRFEVYRKDGKEPVFFDTGIMVKIALGGDRHRELQITDILGGQQWDFSEKNLEVVYIGNFPKEDPEK